MDLVKKFGSWCRPKVWLGYRPLHSHTLGRLAGLWAGEWDGDSVLQSVGMDSVNTVGSWIMIHSGPKHGRGTARVWSGYERVVRLRVGRLLRVEKVGWRA